MARHSSESFAKKRLRNHGRSSLGVGSRRLPRRSEAEAGRRPLTVTLRGAGGRLVQELVFDEAPATNAGVSFRTAAPVFGLGEGAQQFDRRGASYPMEPSWCGRSRPVLGSIVQSPFLIGTEGWALFAHRPEGRVFILEIAGATGESCRRVEFSGRRVSIRF